MVNKNENTHPIENSVLAGVSPISAEVILPEKLIGMIAADMVDLRKMSPISLIEFRNDCILKKNEQLFGVAEDLMQRFLAYTFNGIPTKHYSRSLKESNESAYCILLNKVLAELIQDYCKDTWDIDCVDYRGSLDVLKEKRLIGSETRDALLRLCAVSDHNLTHIECGDVDKRFLDLTESYFEHLMCRIYSKPLDEVF